jgi:hypothetical protein
LNLYIFSADKACQECDECKEMVEKQLIECRNSCKNIKSEDAKQEKSNQFKCNIECMKKFNVDKVCADKCKEIDKVVEDCVKKEISNPMLELFDKSKIVENCCPDFESEECLNSINDFSDKYAELMMKLMFNFKKMAEINDKCMTQVCPKKAQEAKAGFEKAKEALGDVEGLEDLFKKIGEGLAQAVQKEKAAKKVAKPVAA